VSRKKTVIYVRYSSDMQREESCDDQAREVRRGFASRGIDSSDAQVFSDQAESGTRSDRQEFSRLMEMIKRGEVGILAVDDQSRLSRADNAFNLIKDLVYQGGRFISTGENIDTNQEGWELRVKIMDLHHGTTIRELSRRVHRGQKGRVLDEGSAGDFPFGFESYFLDLNWVETARRGPKPKKGLRILETEARWVRQVFAWITIDGWGVAEVARELTRLGVSKGTTSSKRGWHHAQVRRMLANKKYIGQWSWGTTTTIRNSEGKTRRIPTPEKDWVVQDRPHLRIIDQETWDRAQRRLAELDDIYGQKEDQKPRGARPHHTEVYPKTLLGGLIYCRVCGKKLWIRGSESRARYLNCQNHIEGTCAMAGHVPVARAEKALLEFAAKFLTAWPRWLEIALASMRAAVEAASARLPETQKADQARLVEIESRIDNLVDQLSLGASESPALRRRLDSLEADAETIRERVKQGRQALEALTKMPSEEWVREQLAGLPELLSDDPRRAAPLLRRLLGHVEAESIVAPGKERGFIRLHVSLDPRALLEEVLGGQLPDSVLALAAEADGERQQTFEVDLGEPNQRDVWAPKIEEMRKNGVGWKEIGEITKLGTGNAHNVWKRWKYARPKSSAATA
jgi:site-specific DNA recombinase